MRCRFKPIKEVQAKWIGKSGWHLCLQWGKYKYEDKSEETGYRFVYRKPDGKLQTRGQARIPNMQDALDLINEAREQGWGDYFDGQEQDRLKAR